jgi:hypothetical protein
MCRTTKKKTSGSRRTGRGFSSTAPLSDGAGDRAHRYGCAGGPTGEGGGEWASGSKFVEDCRLLSWFGNGSKWSRHRER